MTAWLGLVAICALLAFGALLLRRSRSGGSGGLARVAGAVLVLGAMVFLVWLAIMVIDVGPAMRGR